MRRVFPGGQLPTGAAYARQIALGAAQGQRQPPTYRRGQGGGQLPISSDAEHDPSYEKIPAWYTVSINLGGVAGNTGNGAVQLRPEPFILKRITWATTGDCHPYVNQFPGFSLQGRSVQMEWSDEYTKFFGDQPSLISAVFGDSQGFLDVPRGALFQGSQNLTVKLTRLIWPSSLTAAETRFDFTFTGLGLLPKDVAQSGSAG